MNWTDWETITVQGRDFAVMVEPDEGGMGAPWEECDGHGIVSEWTSRDKRAGERVLSRDRSSYLYYDVAATMRKARAEGWGSNLTGSVRERAAKAVEADFGYCQRWVNGDWYWAAIIVAPLTADGTPDPDNYDVLGGVESFAWEEVPRSMAEDMIAAERREATERAAALSMGIPTVGAR